VKQVDAYLEKHPFSTPTICKQEPAGDCRSSTHAAGVTYRQWSKAGLLLYLLQNFRFCLVLFTGVFGHHSRAHLEVSLFTELHQRR